MSKWWVTDPEAGGRRFKVEAQNAEDAKDVYWAEKERLGRPPPKDVTPEGLGKAAVTGVRRGVEGAVGADRDMAEGMGGVSEGAASKVNELVRPGDPTNEPQADAFGRSVEFATSSVYDKILRAMQMAGIITPETAEQWLSPTTEKVGRATDAATEAVLPTDVNEAVTDISRHRATNTAEEFMETGGEVLPALFTGKINPRTIFSKVVLPTMAIEGAGQGARALDASPEVETAVRMIAGLISGGTAGGLERRAEALQAADVINSTPGAVKRVQTLLENENVAPEELQTKLRELGIEAMPLDATTGLRQEAQTIHSKPGEGRSVIETALRDREAEANTRMETDVRSSFGPKVDRGAEMTEFDRRRKEVNAEYPAARAGQTRPADLQSVDDQLEILINTTKETGLKGKLADIKKSLRTAMQPAAPAKQPFYPPNRAPAPAPPGPSLETTTEALHQIRKKVDGLMNDVHGNPRQDLSREEFMQLGKVREGIDKELAASNPDYKAIDAKFQEVAKDKTAFKEGERVFQKGRPGEFEDVPAPSAMAPDEFERHWNNEMTPGERTAMVKGASREIDRLTGTSSNNRVELKKMIAGEGKWNHQKIATMIGQENADRLVSALEREKVFQESHNRVIHNSKTAETQDVGGEIGSAFNDAAKGGAIGGTPGVLAGLGWNRIKAMAGQMSDRMSQAQRAEIAPLLTTDRPDDLVRAIQMMQKRGAVLPDALIQAMLARQTEVGNR